MQFMSKHKVNPMKGCLPILPSIPVFFAFYRVLSTSIELRQAPFVFWITDLSLKDTYYVTPLLFGIAMLVQQKIMPQTGMDKMQSRMMMILPSKLLLATRELLYLENLNRLLLWRFCKI